MSLTELIHNRQNRLTFVYNLLPQTSDHVIVHLGGSSCAIFYTTLSAREYSEMKLKYPPN